LLCELASSVSLKQLFSLKAADPKQIQLKENKDKCIDFHPLWLIRGKKQGIPTKKDSELWKSNDKWRQTLEPSESIRFDFN
jgi:hypothetical protein